MPSVMTIAGADVPRRKRAKKPRIGDCKTVRDARTKRRQKVCYLGKTKKRPTGWAPVKNH